jgi:hypothetical protein
MKSKKNPTLLILIILVVSAAVFYKTPIHQTNDSNLKRKPIAVFWLPGKMIFQLMSAD